MDTCLTPLRFIGRDLPKHYLVAVGVDAQRTRVLGPQRVALHDLETWRTKHLKPTDALVVEITTNTWDLYDALLPHVHSVTVVHPPQVALITRVQVMTDQIAALTLAEWQAVGLLTPWGVPPPAVRDLRALLAHRAKLVRLQTQAKHRLHSLLHRHRRVPPAGVSLLVTERRAWWLGLSVSAPERLRLQSDLDTLQFAPAQIATLEEALKPLAAADPRVPLLIQMTGFNRINSLTVLAAIGDIPRFPSAAALVGYAGLGTRVHDSGLTQRSGRITKAGRRDLRGALVEAAPAAVLTHPHWPAELARLEPRLGRNKAIVAIARQLLVGIWHLLSEEVADRPAEPERVARKFLNYAYRLGKAHRRKGLSTAGYAREQLDRLRLGADLPAIDRGPNHSLPLPPSQLGE